MAGITYPLEYGGQGLSETELFIMNSEAAEFDLPLAPFGIGLDMCGPAILDLGDAQQRSRFIPPLLRGDEIWCQLFSESGAGSDLASLQTKAVRNGEDWVVNGQKVWTSWAQIADWGLLLARTNPSVPKHLGLTMFAVDMHAAGVTVRPLRDISGGAHFNEVFLDDVHIPAGCVLGGVDQGWPAAITTLRHERTNVGTRVRSRRAALSFDSLRDAAARRQLLADPLVRNRLVDVFVLERLSELVIEHVAEQTRSGQDPGPRGSVVKLSSAVAESEAARATAEIFGSELLGWDDSPELEEMTTALSVARRAGIAGGTNEIQRNIIGERVLRLPRDPYDNRGTPFQDLRVNTSPDRTGQP
jgi:alkylation response protein AidB-like acyl-CoA dehydrogenase